MVKKYNVGDKVQIISHAIYNANIHELNNMIPCMTSRMALCFCGEVVTIRKIENDKYRIVEDDGFHGWTDEMIERLIERKAQPKFKVGDKVILDPFPCVVTDAQWRNDLSEIVYTVKGTDFGKVVREYELVFDERTAPNTDDVISLIKADWKNFKERYNLPSEYHFVDKNGNEVNISEIVLEKKKKEYPKTYEECCEILGCKADFFFTDFSYKGCDVEISDYEDKIDDLLQNFRKLRYCRDAYWKLYGEEMGLSKPWEPIFDIDNNHFVITIHHGKIEKFFGYTPHDILVFPTEEMRDAFYENFKEEIEKCKDLL